MIRLFFCLAMIVAGATPAAAQRVCIEELSGVCLKYEEVRQVSRAEATEQSLSLDLAERQTVQRGLKAAGFYGGAIDGAIGPASRRALSRWQESGGLLVTGFLTLDQVARLTEAARLAASAPTTAPSPAEQVEPASPQAISPASGTAVGGDCTADEIRTGMCAASADQRTDAAPPSEEQEDPIIGKTYQHSELDEYGIRTYLTYKRLSEDRATINLHVKERHYFNENCDIPATGKIECFVRRGSRLRMIDGILPNLKVSGFDKEDPASTFITLW